MTNCSDPSIAGDTPFKSGRSESEIFCQEISNEPMTRQTDNVLKEHHYDVYREIEEIFIVETFSITRFLGKMVEKVTDFIKWPFVK